MLDGSYYIECLCGSDEHTLRFVLDKAEKEIYLSFFLCQYRGFFKRLLVSIKYLFGYKCKYGHWDTVLLGNDQINDLQKMIDDFNILDVKQI